jgi:hypothetical protein
MKKFTLTIVFAFYIFAVFSQEKAFGPLNFGMSKNEAKEAVRNSNNMKLLTGQVHTEILGDKYFGYMEFDESGLVGIGFNNYRGNTAAYMRNYNSYGISDLENDVNEIIELLTDEFGEMTEGEGFVHPGAIDINRTKIAGVWANDYKIIYLNEVNINAVTYPQIVIYKKSYLNQKGRQLNAVKSEEVEETKKMF